MRTNDGDVCPTCGSGVPYGVLPLRAENETWKKTIAELGELNERYRSEATRLRQRNAELAAVAEAAAAVLAVQPDHLPTMLHDALATLRAAVERAATQRRLRAENERLRAALKTVIHAHDGMHTEDCQVSGYGDFFDDDELDDDDCDCGATKGRNEARAALSEGDPRG